MKPLPRFLRAEFVESRVLPVVIAFGVGVLVSGITGDLKAQRIEEERATHRTTVMLLLDEISTARTACGAQPDADAVAQHLAHNANPFEVRK